MFNKATALWDRQKKWGLCGVEYNTGDSGRTKKLSCMMELRILKLENCMGMHLIVTGGRERHPGENPVTGAHPSGDAVDFGFGANPSIQNRKVEMMKCAKCTGFDFAWEEGMPGNHLPNAAPHYHLEWKRHTDNRWNEEPSQPCGTLCENRSR